MTSAPHSYDPPPESIAGKAVAAGIDISSFGNRYRYMTPAAWEIPAGATTTVPADGTMADPPPAPPAGDLEQGFRGQPVPARGRFLTASKAEVQAEFRKYGIYQW